MSIRYSVRYVPQGRYQGLSLFDAAFDLTWLTCLSSENGHLTGTLQSPVQITYDTLLNHDKQLGQLKARPVLLPNAVEEMLRFILFGSALNPRIATANVELGEVTVRAGEPVLCSRSSANRDERVFARAAELDVTRDPNPHVAFGYGPHYCLGAHLARMELQVALGTIFSRLPGLRIAVPDNELTWHAGTMMRGLAAFPVAW